MAEYEGIVAALKENGQAEVVIRPGSAGIPGVSEEVSNKVCHCTTDSSAVNIPAENGPGAGVGDLVVVRRDTGALIKNVASLLGYPLAGGILGTLAVIGLMGGFTAGVTGGLIVVAAGICTGVALGVGVFRRNTNASRAEISSIVKTRVEMASMSGGTSCPVSKKDGFCDSCAGASS